MATARRWSWWTDRLARTTASTRHFERSARTRSTLAGAFHGFSSPQPKRIAPTTETTTAAHIPYQSTRTGRRRREDGHGHSVEDGRAATLRLCGRGWRERSGGVRARRLAHRLAGRPPTGSSSSATDPGSSTPPRLSQYSTSSSACPISSTSARVRSGDSLDTLGDGTSDHVLPTSRTAGRARSARKPDSCTSIRPHASTKPLISPSSSRASDSGLHPIALPQ